MRHRHIGPKVRYTTKRNNIRYRQRPLHNMSPQTLIFPKDKYNKKQALKWAKEHGFKHYTSREEGNSIRIRQFPPEDVKRYGGTFPIGEDIKGLYAEVDKEKYNDKPYNYLKNRFGISAKGDDDEDTVPNRSDCRPWDRKRQDDEQESKEEFRRIYEEKKQKYIDEYNERERIKNMSLAELDEYGDTNILTNQLFLKKAEEEKNKAMINWLDNKKVYDLDED